jgi:hypothetical protein
MPIPLVDVSEIEARAKTDTFSYVLTVIQILYYALVVIFRISKRLTFTPLEAGTTCYVLCAIFTYWIQWPRPRSISAPIIIHELEDRATVLQLLALCNESRSQDYRTSLMLPYALELPPLSTEDKGFWYTWSFDFLLPLCIALTVTGIIQAVVPHFRESPADWPAKVDSTLWLTSASVCAVSFIGPLILRRLLWWGEKLEEVESGKMHFLYWHIPNLGVIVYVLASLTMLAEMVRCLFNSPPDLFINTVWTSMVSQTLVPFPAARLRHGPCLGLAIVYSFAFLSYLLDIPYDFV